MPENGQNTQNNVKTPDVNEQIKNRMDKLKTLQEAGKDPFQITKYDVTHHTSDIKNNFDELEGKEVSIAGRLMQKRVMGKASFCNVADLKDNIQLYVARDCVGEWKESISENPKYAMAYRNLAIAYYNKRKEPAKALAYMKQAFELDSSYPRLLLEYDQLAFPNA